MDIMDHAHVLIMFNWCFRKVNKGSSLQVGLGLGECIASGLRKIDGPQAPSWSFYDGKGWIGGHFNGDPADDRVLFLS